MYFAIYLFFSFTQIIISQFVGHQREYCMETFRPVCTKGSVIIMKRAFYGRMKIGRCMTVDNGQTCFNDELATLDQLCSGTWNCELVIPSPQLTTKLACLTDMMPYLEASYTCEKVTTPKQQRCISPEKVKVTKKPAYLASIVSADTSCGLHGSPWILEAEQGQKIDLKLTDFSWDTSDKRCNQNYGYILDMKSDDVINICGGGKREKHLYLSVGHSVQIVLEGSVMKRFHFIITFQAKGCPEYQPPKYAWIQEDNNTLLVGCDHSDKTWRLRCMDNIWLGIVGNCTPPPVTPVEEPVMIPVLEEEPEPAGGGLPEVSGNHVVAFAMGCITLLVCCTIAVLGIYCTKRYEARIMKLKANSYPSNPVFPSSHGTMRSTTLYKAVTSRGSIPTTTLELPPYALPIAKDNRKPKLPKRPDTYRDNNMLTSMTDSDYLAPQNEAVGDENEVQYYILENPAESMGNMSEEMYQSIHLHNSLQSNKN